MIASLSQYLNKRSVRYSGSSLFWIFFFFFLFCLLLNNSYRYLDPDFGWHLRVGEEIAISGEIPALNTYNYTHSGSWVDHEWLANFLLSRVYKLSGYNGVSILFALLALGAVFLVFREVRRRCPSNPRFLVVALICFGLAASLPSLGVRIQEVGLFFIPLTVVAISIYERTRNWQRIIWLIPLFYLWACLHASFLLGIILLFSGLAWQVISKYLPDHLWGWRLQVENYQPQETARFLAVSVAAAGVTFLTPYGLRLYSFLGGYRDSFYQYHIQEWLSQHIFPLYYLQLLYLAVALSSLVIYLYHARENRLTINLWEISLFVLFFIMAWRSRRHFPLFWAVTLPYVISAIQISFGSFRLSLGRFKPWLLRCSAAVFGLAALLLLVNTSFTSTPFGSFCQSYPCGAVTYLSSHPELGSLRLFNDYGWGGYLIHELPNRLLFIDGRLPQEEFAGHTFLEEYYEFFRDDGDIGAKLDQYNIGLVLLPARDKKIVLSRWEKLVFRISDKELEVHNRLRERLNRADWRIIYSDGTAVLYARVN